MWRGLGGWGQGIQRLEGVQGVPRCPPSAPSPLSKAPGPADRSFSWGSCFASAALLLHVFSLARAGWWRVSRIPLCGMEGTGGGGPRARGLEPASKEARHWPSSQGLGPKRELPAPRYSLPLPPRAPWLLSLPAGPPPSQTAARGRGRSISEQRGPCGLQLKPRIPLSHRQVKRRVYAHAHRHACMAPGSRAQGRGPGRLRDGAGAGLGGIGGPGP